MNDLNAPYVGQSVDDIIQAGIEAAILDESGIPFFGSKRDDYPNAYELGGFPFLVTSTPRLFGSIAGGRQYTGQLAREPMGSEPIWEMDIRCLWPYSQATERGIETIKDARRKLMQLFTEKQKIGPARNITVMGASIQQVMPQKPGMPISELMMTIQSSEIITVDYTGAMAMPS